MKYLESDVKYTLLRVYNCYELLIVRRSDHIEAVNYNLILCKLFWDNMQVLCKLLIAIFTYDPVYSVHPMKYLESDVMW